jgi:hypothetical protein
LGGEDYPSKKLRNAEIFGAKAEELVVNIGGRRLVLVLYGCFCFSRLTA